MIAGSRNCALHRSVESAESPSQIKLNKGFIYVFQKQIQTR